MRTRVLTWAASVLLKLWGGTLRWRFTDDAGYMLRDPSKPLLVGVWHNRIFVLPLCFEWFCRRVRRLNILTSASRDGELLALLVARFGMESVRGSSSRKSVLALRMLQKRLEEGSDIAITPDGPRGPVYEVSPGLLYLAAKSGLPIMTIRVDYEHYWELRSWDKFRIPKPFSRVNIRFQAPVFVEGEDSASLEAAGARLKHLLG
jgi:lysophospholipid acyltransferase (LPLAT)-like uncharacterized protein